MQMKPHKWAKEIKAWANGAEIEYKQDGLGDDWRLDCEPYWWQEDMQFRIKPQPKEPQYLYVYSGKGKVVLNESKYPELITQIDGDYEAISYIGKIKLEQDDE
jgi:hypothetical protein